jgi:predicted peptidase
MEVVPLDSLGGVSPLGYLEYLPQTYAADGEPSPLLVFLHGAGEAGDGSADSLELVHDLGIPQLIAAGDWPPDRQFVVLAPQYGTAEANGECAVADDIAAFLEFALSAYNVDPARVYLTGISCGAIGIWDYLGSDGDELVAAAVPISGHALWALEEAGCVPLSEVPVWAFHGADDDVVPVGFVEEQINQIGACDGADAAAVELTVYPDTGHVESIGPTYDLSAGHDIYAWMLEHVNDPAD